MPLDSYSCIPTGICVPQYRQLLQYGISIVIIESAVEFLFRVLTRFIYRYSVLHEGAKVLFDVKRLRLRG
jgi:hypothetical protein